MRTILRTCLALVLISAAACFLSACGGGKTTVESRSTTTGKELEDLETARSKGLITESEYQKQRKRSLEGK